jgi:hypothetical protein
MCEALGVGVAAITEFPGSVPKWSMDRDQLGAASPQLLVPASAVTIISGNPLLCGLHDD